MECHSVKDVLQVMSHLKIYVLFFHSQDFIPKLGFTEQDFNKAHQALTLTILFYILLYYMFCKHSSRKSDTSVRECD